jgi:hypothetical protein
MNCKARQRALPTGQMNLRRIKGFRELEEKHEEAA